MQCGRGRRGLFGPPLLPPPPASSTSPLQAEHALAALRAYPDAPLFFLTAAARARARITAKNTGPSCSLEPAGAPPLTLRLIAPNIFLGRPRPGAPPRAPAVITRRLRGYIFYSAGESIAADARICHCPAATELATPSTKNSGAAREGHPRAPDPRAHSFILHFDINWTAPAATAPRPGGQRRCRPPRLLFASCARMSDRGPLMLRSPRRDNARAPARRDGPRWHVIRPGQEK